MNNTYLYLSSSGSDNHSDFQVQLPNNLIFSPYSQVRLINGIVGLNQNEIEINDNNNIFYISCDFWIKVNCSMPLVPITLYNGTYNIDELTTHIESRINTRFRDFPNITWSVSYNTSYDDTEYTYTLNFKASYKELYWLPLIKLPDNFITDKNGWIETEDYNAIDTDGDVVQFKKMSAKVSDIMDYSMYGVSLNSNGNLSECIFNGISGGINGTNGTIQPILAIEVDLNGIVDDDYIYFQYGQKITLDNLTKTWGTVDLFYNTLSRFGIEIRKISVEPNKEIEIVYLEVENNSANFIEQLYNIDNNATKLLIAMTETDDNYSSYYTIDVRQKIGGTYSLITTITAQQTYQPIKTVYDSNDYSDTFTYNNKLGIVSNTSQTTPNITVSVCNCTEMYGYNSVTNKFEPTKTTETNINRPISILGSNNPANSKDLNVNFISTMSAQSNVNSSDSLISEYVLNEKYLPNTDTDIGINFFQVLPKDQQSNAASTYSTFTKGLDLNYNVLLNKITFPQCYLEINEFPFNTYTANFNGGTTNRFLSPINFVQTGTDVEGEYQANIYTEQWLTMSNSSPLNVTSLRLRICDISGKILEITKPTSIFTIEIRDNPYLRKQKDRELMNESLKTVVASMIMNNSNQVPRQLNGY